MISVSPSGQQGGRQGSRTLISTGENRVSSAARQAVSGYLPFFSVDPPRVELGSPPRQGGVFPLDHEPVFSSGPPRSRTPITWVQAKCPAVERAARLREVRPGIEPDPRPYQGRVLPKHLQTVVSVIPGGIEPPISWVSSRRLCRWTTGSRQ